MSKLAYKVRVQRIEDCIHPVYCYYFCYSVNVSIYFADSFHIVNFRIFLRGMFPASSRWNYAQLLTRNSLQYITDKNHLSKLTKTMSFSVYFSHMMLTNRTDCLLYRLFLCIQLYRKAMFIWVRKFIATWSIHASGRNSSETCRNRSSGYSGAICDAPPYSSRSV